MAKTVMITVAEAARRFGITTRHVNRLRAEGLPCHGDKVLWPAARVWRDESLVERGRQQAAPTDREAARSRKVAAEAELAELEVAQRRGEVVPVVEVERDVGRLLDGLRARILSMPGKYAPRLGLPIAQAQMRLEEISRELIAELADTADDLVDEEADAAADG